MTGLRVELRRSPGLVTLPMVVLVHAIAVLDWLSPGVDLWVVTSSALVMAVLLSGPIVAGVAAWSGLRERRRRTDYLVRLSPRHPAAAPLAQLLAVAIWSLAAYGLVAAAFLGKTALGATWDRPQLLWVATGAAALAAHAVVGYVAGRAVPRPWMPPIVTIAAYTLNAWNLTQFGDRWHFLSAATAQRVSPFRELNTAMFAAQLTWYVGLAATAFAGWLLISVAAARRITSVVAMACCLALAAAGAFAVVRQERILGGPRGFEYLCGGTQPQVCVHPAFAIGLAQLEREFLALHDKVAGTPADFTRVEQRPRGVGGEPSPGAGRYSLDNLGPGFATSAVMEYVTSVSGPPTCQPDADRPDVLAAIGHGSVVLAWLTESPAALVLTSQSVMDSYRWFAALPEPERRRWFAGHYDGFATCTLGSEDFR